MAAATSFGALQRSCAPAAGRSGTTSRRPISASKATAWTPLGELGHARRQDGVEFGEDAAGDGRGGHAALGHHHADRTAQPERLTAVTTYNDGGASLVKW
ncbi:hypothetical protein ACN24L_01160 [Streptomyces microflavus]